MFILFRIHVNLQIYTFRQKNVDILNLFTSPNYNIATITYAYIPTYNNLVIHLSFKCHC